MVYDIVIVGAGPSGAALASLLDKKYKVLILDRRGVLCDDLDSVIKQCSNDDLVGGKCCGGLLAPNAQKVLASLGWTFPKEILVSPQVFGMKVIDTKTNVTRLYQRSYININRKKFDKWILNKCSKKATIIENATYKSARKVPSGYEITYLKNGELNKVETRVLVGADGANSKVRHEFFKDKKEPKQYAAIQEWYKGTYDEAYYYGIGDDEVTDFYTWIIPKEGYLILGSAMDDSKNANKKFELLKEKLKKHGFHFEKENLVKKEGSIIYRPKSMSEIALVNDEVALIGEASGIISPSSSEGISYALKCGIYLAEELNKDLIFGVKKYEKRAKKLARTAVLKNFRNPFLYNGSFRRMVLKSNINTIKIR